MSEVTVSEIKTRYRDISPVGATSRHMLVKEVGTGNAFVKKTLGLHNLEIIESLTFHPHPHLVKVWQVASDHKETIFIEEYINGVNLLKQVQQNGPFSEEDAGDIVISICKGLEHLNKINPYIKYMNIQPQDVMIDDTNTVRIVDFEMIETEPEDSIYGMGVMLNYLLTGYHPDTLHYTGPMIRIIQRCLSKDPKDKVMKKFKTLQELCRTIEDHMRKFPEGNPDKPNTVFHYGNSRLGKAIAKIPGFRTGKMWKCILALILYSSLIYSWILVLGQIEDIPGKVMATIAIAIILFYFAVFTNFLGIHRFLPLFKSENKTTKVLAYIVYPLALPVFLFVFCLLLALLIIAFRLVFPAS